MALEGTLKDFSLADIFQLIGLQRKTGVLTLRSKDDTVTVTAESILMEGARMIDEWPIIEKRIRSYDMVFRKKLTDQEIVVSDEADEVQFDGSETVSRRRRPGLTDKIRISPEEKHVYDLVDGTMTVGDVVEISKFAEFDTVKALYELLTRDLVEEVRGAAAQTVLDQTPVDEEAVAETPVPLPLVAVLALLAILSIATSFKNPLNTLAPLGHERGSSIVETRKAVSMQRIAHIR